MSPAIYQFNRNKYSYPAVGLLGSLSSYAHANFPAVLPMEAHHRNLLCSQQDAEVALGYLSTIYWGHYSGQKAIHRPARALGKVRMALEGTSRTRNGTKEILRGINVIGVSTAATFIRIANSHVTTGKHDEAIEALTSLPQLRVAFASKVCAFLSPQNCGVIDSVIARKHPMFGFEVDQGGFIKSKKANLLRYKAYCNFLVDEACRLNSLQKIPWTDTDRTVHQWRAVDVERAMY